MRPSRHLALSGAMGGAAWAATGELWTVPIVVAAGVLVDLDHAPDYWWTFALRRRPVTVLALHGWEWLAVLLAVGIWIGFPGWLVAVLVGYGLHIMTDHLFNSGTLWSYSFIYRARHGFRREKVAPNWEFANTYEILRQELPFAASILDRWNGVGALPNGACRKERTSSIGSKPR